MKTPVILDYFARPRSLLFQKLGKSFYQKTQSYGRTSEMNWRFLLDEARAGRLLASPDLIRCEVKLHTNGDDTVHGERSLNDERAIKPDICCASATY